MISKNDNKQSKAKQSKAKKKEELVTKPFLNLPRVLRFSL